MKRIFVLFLSLLILLSTVPTAYSLTVEDTTISFDLTVDGKSTITVPTGTEILITYALNNITSDEEYYVQSIFNQIAYDWDFFEISENAIEIIDSTNAESRPNSWEGRVLFNGYHEPPKAYESSNKLIGRVKLKVLATEGQSTITNQQTTLKAPGNVNYKVTSKDLTVIVGDEPENLFNVVYMNEGEVYKSVQTAGQMTLAAAPYPAPDGYKFAGWECDEIIYQANDTFEVTGDVTFTAKWEEITYDTKYTLTFNTNGGTAVSKLTDTEGTVVDLTTYTTSRTGYSFDGWYSDEALTQKVTSVTLDGDKTVYAKWLTQSSGNSGSTGGSSGGGGGGTSTAKEYTITFENIDGSFFKEHDAKANTEINLENLNLKKDGYEIEGFYTDKEMKYKVSTISLTKDMTLYINWVESDDTPSVKPGYHPEMLTTEHYAYIVGREEGKVEPLANISRAEVATIFYRLLTEEVRGANTTNTNDFADVNDGDWFGTAVSTLAHMGIIKGKSADTFDPAANITRAEFTTIAARFSDAAYEGEDMFTDIEGHWAQSYINAAASIGWVVGSDGLFRPNDSITRAEVMTIVNRVLNRIPESEADLLSEMTRWEDNADTSAWYYLAVQEATNSHTYELKPDGAHEKWTALKENPTWNE